MERSLNTYFKYPRIEYPNGAFGYMTGTKFSWARFENVPCEDNVRRLVYVTGEADSYFTVPARVRVKGKTVTGFVTFRSAFDIDWCPEIDESREGPHFIANKWGKNAALIANAPAFAKALLEGR